MATILATSSASSNDLAIAGEQSLAFSVFTSDQGPLSKTFEVDAEGTLRKRAVAQLTSGTVKTVRVSDLEDLRSVLDGLTTHQAIGAGVCGLATARLVTKKSARGRAKSGVVARTKEFFAFPDGMGLQTLDHDSGPSGGKALPRSEFTAALVKAVPGLQGASMLLGRSVSASVAQTDGVATGDPNKLRCYLIAAKASEIPEIGQAIEARLWAAGYGHFAISKSGGKLKRCLVDTAVWSPERLDFCGKPEIRGEGLELVGRDWVIENSDELITVTLAQVRGKDWAKVQAAAQAAIEAQKNAPSLEARCRQVRSAWLEQRVDKMCEQPGVQREQAEQVCRAFVESDTLAGDFPIRLGDGEWTTARELLTSFDEHQGEYCYAPDATEDSDSATKAVIDFSKRNGKPGIYSFAHGGQFFELRSEGMYTLFLDGAIELAVQDVVRAALTNAREFYTSDQTGRVLRVLPEGGTVEWNAENVHTWVSGRVLCKKVMTNGNLKETDLPIDPVRRFVALTPDMRQLPILKGVSNVPIMLDDGTIISEKGYSNEWVLQWDGEMDAIPADPTINDVIEAIERVMGPWYGSFWATPQDAVRFFAALLTAAIRPTLPTAPAWLITGPDSGGGKSTMAEAICSIASEDFSKIAGGIRFDELVKRVESIVLNNPTAQIFIDNLKTGDAFGSPTFDAMLTAESTNIRTMQTNNNTKARCRGMWAVTGNHLTLQQDAARRVLTIRLRAGKPTGPCPCKYLRDHRLGMVRDLLLIHLAFRKSGWVDEREARSTTYPMWDGKVGGLMAWLGSLVESLTGPALVSWQTWCELANFPSKNWGDIRDGFEENKAIDLTKAEDLELLGAVYRWASQNGKTDEFRPAELAEVVLNYSPHSSIYSDRVSQELWLACLGAKVPVKDTAGTQSSIGLKLTELNGKAVPDQGYTLFKSSRQGRGVRYCFIKY